MNLELYIERIEQYTAGDMSEPERTAFEAELAENTELQQALALYRESEAVIEQSIENNLRLQLQEWAAADQAAQPVTGKPAAKVISMRSMAMRWAAAAIVLLVAGWFILQQSSQGFSDQAIYAANYEQLDGSSLRGNAPESLLGQGSEAFENKNYPVAETFFGQIPASDENYAKAQLYLGHIALQQQQYAQAITAFGKAVQANDTKVTEKAQWNLLLSYLAAGSTEDAAFKTLLEQVAQDANHSYHQKAQILEGQLSDFRRNFVK